MSAYEAPPSRVERHTGQDLIKWIALLTMVLDHMRLAWPSLDNLFILGRFSFPLFCLAIAVNVCRTEAGALFTRSNGRYLMLMVIFAMISEVPYQHIGAAGKLNVLFTLSLGLLVAWGVHHRTWHSLVLALAAAAAAHVLNESLMYGFFGVLLPATFVLAVKRPEFFAMLPVMLCVAVNSRGGLFSQAVHLEPAALSALIVAALAPLLGMALLWSQLTLRVMPVTRWAYWFYPGHLAVLVGVRMAL